MGNKQIYKRLLVIFYDLTGIILAHLCKELKQAISWEFIKSKLFTVAYNVTGAYHLQCGLRVPKHTKSEHTHSHCQRAPKAVWLHFFFVKHSSTSVFPSLLNTTSKWKQLPEGENLILQFFFPKLEISPPLMQMSQKSDMFTNGHQAKYNKH